MHFLVEFQRVGKIGEQIEYALGEYYFYYTMALYTGSRVRQSLRMEENQ